MKKINTNNNINENKKNENPKSKKKIITKKPLFIIIFTLTSSMLLVGFGLLWQWRIDMLSIINAFYLSAVILFFIGFIIYASNNNVFSPLVYGTKTFFLMFAGKKPKLSYYDYVQEIKEKPVSNHWIYLPLIASVPNFIIAIILHIIYNNLYYVSL